MNVPVEFAQSSQSMITPPLSPGGLFILATFAINRNKRTIATAVMIAMNLSFCMAAECNFFYCLRQQRASAGKIRA